MTLLTSVVLLALMILANALYVAAEFAAVSARLPRIQHLAQEGNKLAQRLLPVLATPQTLDRYIAASQIGITLSSLLLGAYGQSQIAPLLEPVFSGFGGMQQAAAESTAIAVVLVVLTVAQMILGELVPKSIALQFPNQTVLMTAVPMGWSLRVLRPFIWLLNGSGLALLKLLGSSHSHRHIHSPKEIELLISESTRGGIIDPEERRMLSRALALGIRRARDVMVPFERMITIELDAPVDELLRLAAESPYTRFPVRTGPREAPVIAGIVHTKQVVADLMHGRRIETVADVMHPPVMVGEKLRADTLIALLRERRVQQAVVTSEDGRVIGMITLEDVLAEVFGRLADELKGKRTGGES